MPIDENPSGVSLPVVTGWTSLEEKGFAYKDKLAASGGVSGLQIRTGSAGKSKLKLKAQGAGLPDGLLPATTWTVQLHDRSSGDCWSSAFPAATVSEPGLFKAKTEIP